MVDGRVFYNSVKPEDYIEMWEFLKKELFPAKKEENAVCCAATHEMKNYELDPELKEDLESVKGAAEGFGNLGQTSQYNN